MSAGEKGRRETRAERPARVAKPETVFSTPPDEHRVDKASIFIRDTTQRKQADERLQDYERIVEGLQEMIAVVDLDYRYLNANDAFLRYRGLERRQVVGHTVSEVLDPEYFEKVVKPKLDECFKGKRVECELKYNYPALGERSLFVCYLPIKGSDGVDRAACVLQDITERKRLEEEREINVRLLSLLNAPSDLHELMHQVTQLLHKWSDCEAVGIRLARGEDFPYFETRGFPAEFVREESQLCLRDAAGQPVRDPAGNPVLECMCGNVLCGRFDPAKPFFTARGSFWSNCTTDMLARTSDADRQCRTRNRCNSEGYESVALVALRMGQTTYGLLQVNDRRKGRFTPQRIAMLERLADNLAVAMAHRQGQETLRQREEYFRALSERAADVITVISRDGTIRYQSPSAGPVFGYTPQELTGRSVFDLMHAEDIGRAQRALAESVATPGSATRIELRLRHKDGSWRVLEATARNLLDDPNVMGVVISSRDVTERKQLEEALRESSQFNREIIASAQEGVVVYDADLRCRVWNPYLERLTGLSASQVLGKSAVEVFPSLRETEIAAGWVAALAGGEATTTEVAYRVPDTNRWGWSRHTNSPLRDSQGRVIGVIALVGDITERKRDELRITAFAHLGQRLNAAKTLRQAAKIILEVADELLGWDCCLFHLYSANEDRLSCLLCMDLINGQRTECNLPDFPRSPTALARRAIEQGGQLMLRAEGDLRQAEGVPFGDTSRRSASIMFVPIRHGTETVGVLSIQSYTPGAYDADSLGTLQALGDYGGGALERVRAQEALGESEATFRSVWERSIDGMRLTDREGRIIAVNAAFCRLVKLPRERLEGQLFSVAYKAHGANDGIEVYQKRFATGDIVPRLSARAQLWNGEEPDLEISVAFVELGGRGKMLLSIFRDVSERTRAESQIEAFSKLGQRLSAARSPAEAARAIYALADQFWKWDSGVLDLQVPESEEIETALAYDLVDGQRREVALPNPVGPPSAMNRRVMAKGAELILRQPEEAPSD